MNPLRERAYQAWNNMKYRCDNPKATRYEKYGGRGITYCKEWASFENFLKDMGLPEEGMTLERIDNDAGYYPGNCVWATRKAQANNTRYNRRVMFDGKFVTVAQLAEKLSLPYETVRQRLVRGWTVSVNGWTKPEPPEPENQMAQYDLCPQCGGDGVVPKPNTLRLQRKKARKGLRETAIKMDISASYLSDLERGRRAWSRELTELFLEAIK